MTTSSPSDGAQARLAHALRRYRRATATSFALLYGGAYGFLAFVRWWEMKAYPPFPTDKIWLGIRFVPALLLLPRVLDGARVLRGHRAALVTHLGWGALLLVSLFGAIAPAWVPFAVVALVAAALGTARDVLGLRYVGARASVPLLGRLALAWLVHDVAWALAGRALFVEATASAAWPVLTALMLGVLTWRALRSTEQALLADQGSP